MEPTRPRISCDRVAKARASFGTLCGQEHCQSEVAVKRNSRRSSRIRFLPLGLARFCCVRKPACISRLFSRCPGAGSPCPFMTGCWVPIVRRTRRKVAKVRFAEYACQKYSGRVGRSAVAKDLDANAVELAVRAHVRHVHTPYDLLLARGAERFDARREVASPVDKSLKRWASRP
jgi:hypothetical protein